MPKKLFGTDGIRGVAGRFPLDARTAFAAGAVLGEWAGRTRRDPEIVLGMDTRESGPWLAASVAGGLISRHARVRFAGVITTPGVAWLAKFGPFAAGVMISASHNPYRDNGIKIFDHSGFKLPDAVEHELENGILALVREGAAHAPAELAADPGLDKLYIRHLARISPSSLEGLSIVLDCAHGAASRLAPELFESLGARVVTLFHEPNGRNINRGCGALHVARLRRSVLSVHADAGAAFDGDADRAILISPRGAIADGDAMLYIAGRDMLAHGQLRGPGGRPAVVATVMSNLGLERAFERLGIALLRTPVGDKYVLEEIERTGANLGGEQSGHVIFRDCATTGDGLLTALRILEIAKTAGADLDTLIQGLDIHPQRLVNVRVRTRRPLAELDSVNAEIRAAEQAFGSQGRVLVRFSGTEPLARVMVEGPASAEVDRFANRIAEAIARELG